MIRTQNFEPNVQFNSNVSLSNFVLSTDTSKSNSTIGTFSGICSGGWKEEENRVRSRPACLESETNLPWSLGHVQLGPNALYVLQACIYKSVKTGLFLKSRVATSNANFNMFVLVFTF